MSDCAKIFGILDLLCIASQPLNTMYSPKHCPSHTGQRIGIRPFSKCGLDEPQARIGRIPGSQVECSSSGDGSRSVHTSVEGPHPGQDIPINCESLCRDPISPDGQEI